MTHTVLLVEDDSAIREMVSQALRSDGYRIIEAADAVDALRAAANYQGLISLLLSDVAMPGVNGVELAKRIRAKRPETKVLFMGGWVSGFDITGYPLLAKIFKPKQLSEQDS